MRNVVFVGSHLGYPMDRTPLGGGAMVGLQLARHWARHAAGSPDLRLTVLGAGSEAPAAELDYAQLPPNRENPPLVHFSELAYARFCRDFEAATTEFLTRHREALNPRKTVVVVNDISESPDLTAVSGMGYPLVSIWHVDVVDFFNRLYLGGVLAPERLTRAFAWMEDRGLAEVLPDLLKLVFQKQRRVVTVSSRLVMPSRRMAATVRRCYPGAPAAAGGIRVIPWGGWEEGPPEDAVEAEASRLRIHYQLRPGSRVLMTLSRISPEKGLHHLLEALALAERLPRFQYTDVVLFICGETAFMRGEAYGRRVRATAERLRRFRVFFPGYLSAGEKRAYFRLANLFVSPSVHESYGLTLVEAMRAGLPVLAGDHAGAEEILAPDCGRKVSYGRSGERSANLASGLAELLADSGALAAMGRRAAAAAAAMTFSRSAETLLSEALDLLGGPPAAAPKKRAAPGEVAG